MKESTRKLWTARLLALAVMSFVLSFVASMATENGQLYKKSIEIRTTENVGEIISAVEVLGRDDVEIKTKDAPWSVKKPVLLWGTIGLFMAFGFFLAIYHTIYCMIDGLLGLIKDDSGQLHGHLTEEYPPGDGG